MFFKQKKFPMALNTAVFTTKHVMKEGSPITLVSHEIDGDWQFMGNEPIVDYPAVAMIVSLGEIIKKDKSVLKVADLPSGYQATRMDKSSKWEIVKIEYSDQDIKEMGFQCSSCGEFHKDIPMAYGTKVPFDYGEIPEAEVESRCSLTQDGCIIDGSQFYIRGQLNIPVSGAEEFRWNVWVSISKNDFERAEEVWKDENRILEKPYPGKVATQLECYPETLGLSVMVHTQKVGTTPIIEVQESRHPLFLEQENGIDMERVISFAREIIYKH